MIAPPGTPPPAKKTLWDEAPVVASGELGAGDLGDLGGAAEFAGHDDEGVVEEAAVVEVVEEGGHGAVHRGEEVVFQVGEGGFVGVPGFVVAEVDLHEADAGFDELAGHEEGPAEGVATVAVEGFGIGFHHVERGLGLGVGEHRDSHLAVAVEAGVFGGLFEEFALGLEFAEEAEAVAEAFFGEAFGEGEVGGLEDELVGESALAVMEVVFGKCAVAFGVVGAASRKKGLRWEPMRPANCPGITRPVLWTILSGSWMTGGRLLRGRRASLATAVIEGQSESLGLLGLKPTGMGSGR